MNDNKFILNESDIEKYWNKENLTFQETSALIFGLNPDYFTEFLKLNSEDAYVAVSEIEKKKKAEDNEFWSEYVKFIKNDSIFHDNIILLDVLAYLKKYWKESEEEKLKFVKKVYDNGFGFLNSDYKVSKSLKEYLVSIGENIFDYDKYENFEIYKYEYYSKDSLTNNHANNIPTNSNEAAAYLLGLNLEYLLKFIPIHKFLKEKNYYDLSDDEKCFSRNYRMFLINFYNRSFHSPESSIIKAFKDISSIKFYNFSNFVVSARAKGYIVKEHIKINLKSHGINCYVGSDSLKSFIAVKWLEVFKSKVNEAVWTEEEAYKIFTGIFSDDVQLIDLRDMASQFVYTGGDNDLFEYNSSAMAYNRVSQEYFNIGELLRRHIEAEIIKPTSNFIQNGKTQYRFKVKDIFQWLLDNTNYRPPIEMIEAILGQNSSDEAKTSNIYKVEDRIDHFERVNHSIVAPPKKIALWHKDIEGALRDFRESNPQTNPTASAIRSYIEEKKVIDNNYCPNILKFEKGLIYLLNTKVREFKTLHNLINSLS